MIKIYPSNVKTIAPQGATPWPLKITEVYKCPKCGHSEIMKDGKDVIY